MKKIISLIALLIISGAATATAQWRYGFKFSGNFNTSKLSDAPGYSLKKGSGFRGGLMLEWQAPRCGFAFSAAALYNRNNARLEEASGQLSDFGRDFLEIPLYAEYKFFMMKELFAPMVYTGPQLEELHIEGRAVGLCRGL